MRHFTGSRSVLASVVDVAHEAARRALLADVVPTPRKASAIGRLVDPADERLWRDAIRAEWVAGNIEAIQEVTAQLLAQLDAVDDDPDPETAELPTEIEHPTTRQNAYAI